MDNTLIFLDADSQLSLQAQIRQKLVEAINSGMFPLGRRLPSSRKLAKQLGVARNTVVLAYEQLIEEGYLISRERTVFSSIRRLLEYCDLPWEDDCLHFYENSAASTTASASQVREPVYRSSVGKWRCYRGQLQPLRQILEQSGVDLHE
jgi:DNA-binding transcriptional MocR family regulator